MNPRHRDTSLLLLAKASGPVVTVVLMAWLARARGPQEVGSYGVAMALFSLLEAAASLGFRHLLPRELARGPQRPILGSATVVSGLAGMFLALATTVVATRSPLFGLFLWVAASLPWAALGVVVEASWLAREEVFPLFRALMVEQVVRLVAGGLLIHAGAGASALVALLCIGRALAVALAIPPCGLAVRSATRQAIGSLLRSVPVFVALEGMFQLYWRVDVILLAWLRSMEEVGFYVAAYRVFSAVLLLPQCSGQVLLPRMSRGRTPQLVREGIVEHGGVGAFVTVLLVVTSPLIMSALYGPGFSEAARVLRILSMGVVLASVDQVMGRALVARHKQGADLAVLTLATVVNVGLNLVLIPRHGAVGAAAATLVSLGVSFTGHQWALRRP